MKVSLLKWKKFLSDRLVYWALLSQKCTSPTRSQHKWIMDLNNNKSVKPLWSKAVTLGSEYTKRTRVMEFQFTFLHRRIATNLTNDFRRKIGLENNSNCCFCGKEGLVNLFWFCHYNLLFSAAFFGELISRLILSRFCLLSINWTCK